ncbi:MAG: hypothetical protein ACOX7P_01460 [Oscillospiraceae bacterium]|jgi:hypothetical protein
MRKKKNGRKQQYFKMETASEIGINQFANDHFKGHVPTNYKPGDVVGRPGRRMVQRINESEDDLTEKY